MPWTAPESGITAGIAALPKVELHVHLEGAMSPETVWELAERNRVELGCSSVEDWKATFSFRDFDHFLEVYGAVTETLRTAGDFAFVAERFCAEQAAQNIRHSEVFISASYHLRNIEPEALADGLAAGVAKGIAANDVSLRMIPDISRHAPESADDVLAFVKMASRRHPQLFIGLGLGGREEGFPPEQFARVFAEARAVGLHAVAHAGETVGAESVRAAVEVLGAERIGHGIRCLEDPGLVSILCERQVPIEVCPISNYRTGAIGLSATHPVRRMIEAGLYCTVNSDDPTMFSGSLADNYALLAAQGSGLEALEQLAANSLRAAFARDAC